MVVKNQVSGAPICRSTKNLAGKKRKRTESQKAFFSFINNLKNSNKIRDRKIEPTRVTKSMALGVEIKLETKVIIMEYPGK